MDACNRLNIEELVLKKMNNENEKRYSYLILKNISKTSEMEEIYEKSERNIVKEREVILNVLKKIPLALKYISNDCILNKVKIEEKEVHKTSQKNVMIKQIKLEGDYNLSFFLGNPLKTTEICLDHDNKHHVEAIYLNEICRQSCMFTLNKFMEFHTDYFIMEDFRKFLKEVERDKEVIIQTFTSKIYKNKGITICYYALFQDEVLCMIGFYLVYYMRGVY